MKERKIGETFEYEGKKLQVKESEHVSCRGCFFDGKCLSIAKEAAGLCEAVNRGDNKEVIFAEMQEQAEQPQEQAEQPQEAEEIKERKVGEVFEYQGKRLIVNEMKNGCDGCFFDGQIDCECSKEESGYCGIYNRSDHKNVIFKEVKDEQPQEQPEQPQEQTEQLNLCEVLKYCPQGETFWSPMLDGVNFLFIDERRQMIMVETIEGHFTWEINADGTISIDELTSPEIMLYPSREQRDWTKVKYEKKLPKTWKKFCENYPRKKDEAYFDMGSEICIFSQDYEYRTEDTDKNIMPSKQAAEAHLALMQLHQLRDAWREGWLPDWTDDNQIKYVIYNTEGGFRIGRFSSTRRFLAFQDDKRADEFLKCFRDLIKQAGDLI